MSKRVAVIGGGAASYFFVNNCAKENPQHRFVILEQGKNVLQKVKVSGGGRCNVTNSMELPEELVQNYPRGHRELLGPFHHFNCGHTQQWFTQRGVGLKTEEDGRVFPQSNQSQTIIDCLRSIEKLPNVEVHLSTKVNQIETQNNGGDGFKVHLNNGEKVESDFLFMGSGSNAKVWAMLEDLGHNIITPVPSLFTFRINDVRISNLAGVSVDNVKISSPDCDYVSEGPILITHKGISGPSVLKLSAFGARSFFECAYQFPIEINFIPDLTLQELKQLREREGKKMLSECRFKIPKRLQQRLLESSGLDLSKKLASFSNNEMVILHESLCKSIFQVLGQNKFKEEFVTAGGIQLSEVNLRAFSSKLIQNMYFAGEVLNIDAITGGFNFQAAWTGAYLAAQDFNAQ